MTVDFKYEIGQKVYIKAIEVTATVRIQRRDPLGISYFVTYWYNGEFREVTLFEDELSQGI